MTSTLKPPTAALPRRLPHLVVLLVVALIEVVWLAWILQEPMPNVANAGGVLRRSYLLWRMLPGVVPGVTWSQSYLGQAGRQLAEPRNLVDRVPIVLAAGFIAAAAALGSLVLRRLGEQNDRSPLEFLALSYGVGASILGITTLLVGRLVGLAAWPTRLTLALLITLGLLDTWRYRGGRIRPMIGRPVLGNPAAWVSGLVVVPFLLLMCLGAMQPTIEFDALEYHLQGPKEHYQAGCIAFLAHNVYTSMPAGVEMLHLLAMEVLDDWWAGALGGQLLVMLFLPAAALLIRGTACRLASPRAGRIAAIVFLTTPWVFRLAVTPFVEGPLCFYHAALVAFAFCGADRDNPRHWLLAGLLAGGAFACKYPALISAVLPFGLLALAASYHLRSCRPMFGFALGLALIAGPWLLRNLLDTGNPVYPLAYSIFGGSHWSVELDARWAAVHGPRPTSLAALADGLLEVAGRSDWQSLLYTALAPLALLRPGTRRGAAWLWAYAAYLFVTWFLLTHRLDRFWIPMLPTLAVLAGLGADWSRNRAWSIVLLVVLSLGIAASGVLATTDLCGPNRWTAPLVTIREATITELNPPLALLDRSLPPAARVLLIGQASVFPLDQPILYSTVFNHELFERLARGRTASEVHAGLRERKISYVYVDWAEIARYRKPGNYGFSDFITPERFAALVAAGVLGPPEPLGPRHDLYAVR
jgi:hypothetical protein